MNRFRFRFDSVYGVEYNIYILKEGYTGTCDQRPLGRTPVLKKKRNGPICGTSLELFAQCNTDGEYAELYTSDPKEYRVDVYRKIGSTNYLIWRGFVSTELYSAPAIAPPYDVQIVATDGLGELKLNDYEAQGEISLKNLLSYLLSFTGYDRGFYFATNLKKYGGTKQGMLDWLIDLDFMADEGKNCYEVLTSILHTLHATITTYYGVWLIARETDIATLLNNSGGLAVITYFNGTASTTTLSGVKNTVGQRGVYDLWPIGNYSSSVNPAKKEVVVSSRWHTNNILNNPSLVNTLGGWTLGGQTQWISGGGIIVGYNAYDGSISQSFSLSSLQSELKIQLLAKAQSNISAYKPMMYWYAIYQTADATYYGDSEGWVYDNVPSSPRSTVELPKYSSSQPRAEYEGTISNPFITAPGTLTIYIAGKSVDLGYAYLTLTPASKGYRDTIYIDNGSRGTEDEKVILHGRILDDEFTYPQLLSGAFKEVVNSTKAFIYKFADSNYSNKDLLALIALGNALSVALPRLRIEGTFNVPATMKTLPIVIGEGQLTHIVETFEWDLYNEEARISALSLPAASITVESESVVPLDDTSSGGSASGGSGSSSGGGGSSAGTSLLRVWRSLTNNDSLEDYDADTQIAIAHLAALFVRQTYLDSGVTHQYLKLNTAFEGLTTAGYITAGTAAAASDARLKDDIKTIPAVKAIRLLAALRGAEWIWNGKHECLAGKRGSGLIAQEVEKVMPWAVLDLNGELSLNYNTFWGVAIPVMQAHEARIKSLEKEVEELKTKLKKITGDE